MNMSVDYFILCENSITDPLGKVSMIGTYDSIYAEKLPALHSGMHFVIRLLATDLKARQKKLFSFVIKSPSGERLGLEGFDSMEVEFTKDRPAININLAISGIVLNEFGIHEAILTENKKDGASFSRSFKVLKGGAGDAREHNQQ